MAVNSYPLANGLGDPLRLVTRGYDSASAPVGPVHGRLLTRGLGVGQRLVIRGLSSAANPAGPVRSGVLTRGLGVSQRLVTRGLGTDVVPIFPEDLPEAIATYALASSALLATGLGLWADQKPRGEPMPALILKVPDGTRIGGDAGESWMRLNPRLEVFASTKIESARLGAIVEGVFKGQGFAYGAGGAIRTGPWLVKAVRRAKDAGETIAGEKVFRHTLDFECFEFRPI